MLSVNSQLLDLLLYINDSKRIPKHLQYDLRSPTPEASAIPALEPDHSPCRIHDANGARAALEEAKVELATGQITPTTYQKLEAELLETTNKPSRTLTYLDTTPHTTLASVVPNDLPSDLDEDTPTGYLSPNHEHEFLSNLDNNLANATSDARPAHLFQQVRGNEKEKEKEAQLRNPVSVHNWLRKHHPSVFLQDEPNPEKVSPKHATKTSPKPSRESRSAKRSSTAPKQEHELIDEEGYVIGGNLEVPPRNKRKREDEPYRPKGGSSRSAKKKKTSGAAKRTLENDEAS